MVRRLVAVLGCLLGVAATAAAEPSARPAALSGRAGVEMASSCDGRHLCRQMRSCAEARYFLEVCGVSRLDGDGDGVPCETLCGSH